MATSKLSAKSLLVREKRPLGTFPTTVPPTPQPQVGGFMSDARRQRQPQATASSPPPNTSSTGRAASAPSPSAEAAANEAGQSRVAKEELLEEVAGGPPRAAPASEGGRVRDPWESLKDAKESTLAFADFAAKAFADLEGDVAVSCFFGEDNLCKPFLS